MTQQTRAQLRNFFRKNAIPTESNFADLIESSPNSQDDGLFRDANGGIGIVSGTAADKAVLRFYDTAPAANVTAKWSLTLNPPLPRGAPASGLGVLDATGKPRLILTNT